MFGIQKNQTLQNDAKQCASISRYWERGKLQKKKKEKIPYH